MKQPDMDTIDTLEIARYIQELFTEKIPPAMTYHNLIHTEQVVNQAIIIGKKSGLNGRELDLVIAAAWFHDSGYTASLTDHEKESGRIAQEYLSSKGVRQDDIDRVLRCIDATRMPQDPGDDLLSKVLCDADMSYLAEDLYIDRTMYLWKEWNTVNRRDMSKCDYIRDTLDWFKSHSFHTEYGRQFLTPGKEENFRRLQELLGKLEGKSLSKAEKQKGEGKKNQNKEEQDLLPGRGVESMFRLTARNQINLSSIADNKANILISVNSILLTVLLTVGVTKIADYPRFILPVIALVSTSLVAMIFAILSTRPKISSGKFTKEDLKNQKVNLLFFGNFYKMSFEEYENAVKEMIMNSNYLYTNMIRDQYSLGLVISKKYRLLRTAYSLFMYGLILSTALFALVLFFK